MKNPIFSLIGLAAKRAKANLDRQTYQPARTQEQFLQTLLKVQAQTELGQTFGLDRITSVAAFRRQVPILPYSAYQPYLERAAAGEQNVVTPDPLIYMNMTSGSTGSQKMIPVTKRSKRAVEQANQAATGFLFTTAERHHLPLGKTLLTGSARKVGKTSGGIDYGHISGGSVQLANGLYRQIFAQPLDAMLVKNSQARNYISLLFALRNANLRIFAATFPLIALQLCDDLDRYGEALVDDLASGHISPHIALTPQERSQLQRQFRAAPQRANELAQVLNREGRLTPQFAWPGLSCVITARGGTSDFYFERFPDYFGNTPIFGGTYASSESTYGVHRGFNTDGTILALSSNFFEFIPEDQWDVDQPQTLLPHELHIGERYRILITNYAGFYRYDIGDVVEVEGFYNQTPLIMFRYRHGGVLSATTEKTSEYQVIQVLKLLQQQFDMQLEDFCVTLSEDILRSHYILNVELSAGETLTNPEQFLALFDQLMCQHNHSYEVKRQNNDIPAPQLNILAPGSFAILRQRPLRPGVENSQLKFPHISSDRNLLADFVVQQTVALPQFAQPTPILL